MKQHLLILLFLFFSGITFGQTIDITANAATSGLSGFGNNWYAANESIYTETEIGAANFTTAPTAINKIGLNIATVGTNPTFGSVKIYFKEVGGTEVFTTGTYTTAGYTQVFGGAGGGTVVGSATGWVEIPLSASFQRTTGNNLQVLIERQDNTPHASFVYRTANGNNNGSTVLSCRRYNSTTALSGSTSLSVSAFRAQIRFKHESVNDGAVAEVYTLGKLPVPYSVPHTVSANIFNNGSGILTAIPVTLNVTGANSFSDVQNIASLAPGARTTVVFTSYTPTATGSDNISVSIPADGDNLNNARSVTQAVNINTWSYAYGTTPSGSVGFTGTSGDISAKFNTAVAMNLIQVAVNFSGGGQPYKIAVWNAAGAGGSPGALLFETASLTSTAGVNVIPFSAAVPLASGDFYVGVKQTGNTNITFSYQIENPIRTNTFYFTQPTGNSVWTDFAPNNPFRFMIEPKLQLATDALVSNIVLPNIGNTTCSSNNETISATLTNVGANAIAINAATITLKITGANPQTISVMNTTNIVSGGTEQITFTGVNLTNPGINYDTVYVNLPGDLEKANDTAKATQTTSARTVALETVVSTYPLTANCDDMGWTYYKDAADKSVLAVEWGTNTASKTAANASLTLDATYYAATSGSGASAQGTFTMRRYWNIDVAAAQPATPVNVRFFYDIAEKNAADAAAASYQSANAGSIVETPSWFKTNSGAFAGDAAHVNPDGVINASLLTDVNAGPGATINGVLYAQFNGITGFSGGSYAAGVGSGSILPVSIEFFRGSKQLVANYLEWKVSCTGAASVVISLERSADGRNFNIIQQQNAAAARCLQPFTYTDNTPLAGANYYRLKTTSPDGKIAYSTIVVLLNKDKGFELISIAPNPVTNSAVLTVTTIKAGKFSLTVSDPAGKRISSREVIVFSGTNLIDMNFKSLTAGTYFLATTNTDGEKKTIRFVKN